jgi:hypothetical protein
VQTVPSTPPLQFELPEGGGAQVPIRPPSARSHIPVQHSPSWAQASPVWTQNEGFAQYPWSQKVEQQSVDAPHALPSVRHNGLSGVQVPEHFPLQQTPSAAHG